MDELILKKYAYKKKKPVLLPFARDIQILLEHDATQKSVLEYLENEKGIKVSQAYLSKFIKQYIYGNKNSDTIQKSITTQQSKNSAKEDNAKENLEDKDTQKSMEEYMKNMEHIFEAKKRR